MNRKEKAAMRDNIQATVERYEKKGYVFDFHIHSFKEFRTDELKKHILKCDHVAIVAKGIKMNRQ